MDVVVGQARKQLLGKAAQNIRQNRPVFETDPEIIRAIDEASMSQKKHWWKTNKVATPDIILSKNDRNILRKVKSRAWYLDKGFHCCCCNIGLDAIIGLIPGIGDVITTVMAMQLVRTAAKANLPGSLIVQMMWNVFLDFIIGLTPVAGDLLDVFFKCNWRNAMLLEEYLLVRRRDELRLEKGNHNGGPLSLHDKGRLVERALADEEGTSHSVTQPLLPPPQRSDHEGTDNKKKYGSLFK